MSMFSFEDTLYVFGGFDNHYKKLEACNDFHEFCVKTHYYCKELSKDHKDYEFTPREN